VVGNTPISAGYKIVLTDWRHALPCDQSYQHVKY
jgi:hypothetical protein